VGLLVSEATAEYAEKKSPREHSLQTGHCRNYISLYFPPMAMCTAR
jgi:hypothetical protein